MDQFKAHINDWNQPQILSLFVVVLICFALSLTIYIKIKKESRVDKAPKGLIFLAEGYVSYIDGIYEDTTEGRIKPARIYIFGLSTFILFGNMIGLFGLEPITTSYSVTLTMGLITWLGIYVVGIMYKKFRFFKKFLNPIELVGQFAPLISISFRIFGNIIGGGTIVLLFYIVAGELWGLITNNTGPKLFFFAPIIAPFLHLYFDVFGSLIQVLVFSILTTVYWSQEAIVENKENKQEDAPHVAEDHQVLNQGTKVKTFNKQANVY